VTPTEDRAIGVLLASACADALGAGYEFGPPLPADTPVSMRGGNGFRPGEWTDDTSMAIAVAEAALRHPLTTEAGLDAVATEFLRWVASDPNDIGVQTRGVLRHVSGPTAEALREAATTFTNEHPGRNAGNGALMRTAPVALSTLNNTDQDAARAAIEVGRLTHADPSSGEACALWTLAIRHAIQHGTFDGLRQALSYLDADSARRWAELLDEAENKSPADFEHNGWVVQALQAAWSAIVTTPVPPDEPQRHLVRALENAVRGGRDADTVATIAGGLLGARWGASAIPPEWTDAIFGWPGYRANDLTRIAQALIPGSPRPSSNELT
jgi:ADP-ribosylglycohydrolase